MKNKSIYILLVLFAFSFIVIPSAFADNCKVVEGNIIEFQTSGEGQPLTTNGRVTGNLVGKYKFELTGGEPTDPIAEVLFFSGESSIRTREGKINLIELGALDTRRPGNFSDLAIVTGGTKAFEGATGQIHTYGNFDLTTGVGNFSYKGTVCTSSS